MIRKKSSYIQVCAFVKNTNNTTSLDIEKDSHALDALVQKLLGMSFSFDVLEPDNVTWLDGPGLSVRGRHLDASLERYFELEKKELLNLFNGLERRRGREYSGLREI
jgi:hypothetical protein